MSKRRMVWFVALVLALVLAGVAVGCGGGDDTTTTAGGGATTTGASTETTAVAGDLAPEQTLTLNLSTEPPSIDPNIATDTTSAMVINNIFEGLVHLKADGSAEPGIAEKWEVSDDKLTYSFFLRGTDKWSNGDTVTSQDFKNSWLRILDPATAGQYAYQLYFVKGAEEYNGGKGTADAVAIDATDPKVLKVTLKAPTPWFVPLMAHQAYYPIPKKTVDEFGDKWTEPANIVTNGPYKMTSWNHESDLTLEKWADWRDAANVKLTKVNLVMINEDTTAVAAFENGEIDVQLNLPVADMDRLKTLPEFKKFPDLGVFYLGFDVSQKPLNNADVRKALALAIDRQAIVDNVTKAGQVPASGFAPQGIAGFDVLKKDFLKPTAQVDEAKALLAKAGYPDGAGLGDITIYYNTSEGNQAICEAVQAQWTAIGVKAVLKNMEWKQYIAFLPTDESVKLYRMAWGADFNDAYNFYDVVRPGGGNNYTHWTNDAYLADLTTNALAAPDDAARFEVYSQMEDILSVQEMPVAPIYWTVNTDLVKSYVQGYEPSALAQTTYLWPITILKH